MGAIAWLEAAARKEIDPQRQIMRPAEIRYELLEEPVRALVAALNTTSAVETLGSCGGHPFEHPGRHARGRTAFVLLHVLEESGWREVALAIASAVQLIDGAILTVTFDHEAQLRLEVDADLDAEERRSLLDVVLAAAACAVENFGSWAGGLAAD